MIITKLQYIIIEDLPYNLKEALQFITVQQHNLYNIDPYSHSNNSFTIEHLNYLNEPYDFSFWRSHQQYIYLYVILKGEEIMDINNIHNLSIYQKYNKQNDTILYTGMTQHRLRLEQGHIAILYPEEAYRIHYIPGSPIQKIRLKISIG